MKCTNCGFESATTGAFCTNCGAVLQMTEKTKSQKGIFIWISVIGAVLLVGIVLAFCLLPTAVNGSQNVQVQANIANWGLVVSDGQNTWVSQLDYGIFQIDETGERTLLIQGDYLDMGLLGDTIYCVENTGENDSIYTVVAINIHTGTKHTVYEAPAENMQIISANVINDKYYFIVDGDTLYSVDAWRNVENTGIRGAIKITQSGVYTSLTGNLGLKLTDYDGKTIKTYPQLDAYNVWVDFEMDNMVYLHYTENDAKKTYRMDKNSGALTLFPGNEAFYNRNMMSYLNYYEGTFYITTAKQLEGAMEYSVYSMDGNGENVKRIYTKQDTAYMLPFCTANIAQGYLYIHIPPLGESYERILLN